jgi:DNA-binding transcriptional ArsR family regulator
MPFRNTAAKRLAELFGLLSNQHRVRLIEELNRRGELDVNSLEAELGISHSAVSQHLGLLRAHRIVTERRDGRHVYYRLTQHRIAEWVLNGLEFLEREVQQMEPVLAELEQARAYWSPAKRATGGKPR